MKSGYASNTPGKQLQLSVFYSQGTCGEREVKQLEQGHTAGGQKSYDSTGVRFTPKLRHCLATSLP